jgi:trimeric autotransporter adhesin
VQDLFLSHNKQTTSMNSSFDVGQSLLPAEGNLEAGPDDASLNGDDDGNVSVSDNGGDDYDYDNADTASVGSQTYRAADRGEGGGGDRCYSDPPGDLENHRSIVLDDDYYDFDDSECEMEVGEVGEESDAGALGLSSSDDLVVEEAGYASELPNDSSNATGAGGVAAAEGQGRRIPVRRTQSSSLRRRTSSGGSGNESLGDGSASALSVPDESPRSAHKKILVSGMASATGSPIVIRARRSAPSSAGTPERRTKLLVRASSGDGPRTPTYQQRGSSSRRASRGVVQVVRSRSSGEDIAALQRAVAASSLRRTPTRTRRIVVRSRSDSAPTTPTRSTTSSSTSASPKEVEGSRATGLCGELLGVPLAEASSSDGGQRKSAAANADETMNAKSALNSLSSSSTRQSSQTRSPGLSKSCHASKRSPSSSAGASSRRSNQLSSTSHGKSAKSRSAMRRDREGSGDVNGDSSGKKSLDAHTIHVSRLSKERRKESKDSRTASSLQLNIGDPSSVDLASFPALVDGDNDMPAPPQARRCISASASGSVFSSSLQLDISNPSNVNTCSFPPADADLDGTVERTSTSSSGGGGGGGATANSTSTNNDSGVESTARQPTKDSVPGLFFKVQSHILRRPMLSSQT